MSSAPSHIVPAQSPLQGILWMLASGLCFVGVTGVVRYLGTDLPAAQSAFLRFGWGALFLLPALITVARGGVARGVMRLHLMRGVLHIAAVVCWFYAMARIPLAEVTAIGYLNPVLLTLGMAVFMGEKLAFRRLAAIAVALLGALIVLRPGLREVTQGHLSQVAAACFFAGSYLFAKKLSAMVSAGQAVAVLSLIVTIGLAPFAWLVWVPVTVAQIGWLAVVAACATAGHYCMSRAFALAPVAVTQPVVFLQLVWATLLGRIVFGEAVDPFVLLGGGVIVASVSYITWREATLRKAPSVTPEV
ncbi:MAG: DMT family transporter [Rhodobacteraceae bacterium]|nr:DMT family transporter [Paracoccaceae bacterium]MCF8514484.1 DMT family transporter [Paracoccaceae bacterium]MCF8518976.1 DMT family transporter [Paracoccaceae bacterium]